MRRLRFNSVIQDNNKSSLSTLPNLITVTNIRFLSISFFIIFALSSLLSAEILVLKVGAYENRPKIYMSEEGRYRGLFPDVLNSIAKQENWEIKYVPGSWNECLSRLENNEIDIMVDVAFSNEREEKYNFNAETFLVNWATIYSVNGKIVESFVDLKGLRIAVMDGSIHTDGEGGIKRILREFDIDCSFIRVQSYKDVFDAMIKGEADAGVVNRIFGSLNAGKYPIYKTSIMFNPRNIMFAFPKESSMYKYLSVTIDRHLKEMKKNNESVYNKAVYAYLSGLSEDAVTNDTDSQLKSGLYLSEQEKQWLKDHEVIKLGIDPEFAPFEFIDETGNYNGIANDYIEILQEMLGVKFEVVKGISWKDATDRIAQKQIDILPCVAITPDRRDFMEFSRAYINFQRVIINEETQPFVTGISDIAGLRVAVQARSSHESFLLYETDIKPVSYESQQEALKAVSLGRADAFIGNVSSSSYWIKKLNLTNLKIAAPVSQKTFSLHFGIRDDWDILKGIIDKALVSISEEKKKAIMDKWIKIEYKPGISKKVIFMYALPAIALIIIVVLIVALWNFNLKKEIFKRRKAEAKLHSANNELKKLDQLKSMFIASMSHELRTPLNSIIGFTGIILQEMTGPLNEKQKDHLTRVYGSAKHLLALITDIIDISKIEAGRLDIKFERFNILDVIEKALNNITPMLKRKKSLKLENYIQDEIWLYTDKRRLLQCLINFLSNAVKYSEAGIIKIFYIIEGDFITLSVEDTGIGISVEDQKRLFEAFERVESHLKVKAGGTGLGLYLTKKLVNEILKGEVIVKSEIGKGSVFSLRIPISIEGENHE